MCQTGMNRFDVYCPVRSSVLEEGWFKPECHRPSDCSEERVDDVLLDFERDFIPPPVMNELVGLDF